MPTPAASSFKVNGITFSPPALPIVGICLDGSSEEYLNAALAHGVMPHLATCIAKGRRAVARGALPSFTNVNNASIVTGTPPRVHGICGNYFLDPQTGEEVMMNSSSYLRVGTILAAAAQAGRRVGVVTAKEKLRDFLSHELEGIAFSTEKASEASLSTHGIDQVEALVGKPTPPIYSPEASIFVLEAGVALLREGRADFLYLSTTDYVQHTYSPEAPEALDFYHQLDHSIGELHRLGAIIGITADHGMNAKQQLDGSPHVLYLETALTEGFGEGFRVILPITDPYVAHHGALGSFAVVHTPAGSDLNAIATWILNHKGVTEVYPRELAASKLELPEDRLGDLVVLAGRDLTLGRTPGHHDLSALHGSLRSHGGRYEEMVPFIFNHPLQPGYEARVIGDPRNFELFDFTVNGTLASS